jgi:Mn2+/Fe2+ NRAMP family transporter
MSTIEVKKVSGYDTNNNLKTAAKYLTIASVLCWIIVAILVILFVLGLIFGAAILLEFSSLITVAVLFVVFALALVIGIMSGISCTKIKSGKSYNEALVSTLSSFTAIFVVLMSLLISMSVKIATRH